MSSEHDSRPTPLDDVRVVEISDRIAGSYCGKLLVDAGAEVRKIEPPQGDPLRRFSASCSPIPDGTHSPLFSYLNAGKRSLTWPAAGPRSDERFHDELACADIVVVTSTRAQAADLGIDPLRLLADNPQSVVVTISDFGWTGPYAERAASEFTLQAWSGLTGFRGDPAGPPIAIGGDLGEYMGGVSAAFGALALRRRVERGGRGEHLDLSMLEAITLMQSGEWLHSQLLQAPPVSRTVEVPSIEPAKDGYIGITMVTGQQWLDFAAMVDCHELTEIPQLSFQIGRWQYRDFIRDRICPWLAEPPSRKSSNSDSCSGCRLRRWVTAPRSARPPMRPNAGCSCATRRAFTSLARRGYVALPARIAAQRAVARRSQQRHALVQARARRAASRAPAAARGPSRRRPDRVLGRPRRDSSLAAFGADVVKVESIQRPDGIRYSGACARMSTTGGSTAGCFTR